MELHPLGTVYRLRDTNKHRSALKMHTQPLHLLTFKCTMFPRSPRDSGDRICGLPAAGSLSLAFTLAQSLMWSDQTLMTHIPSSASGYIESQGNMGNRCVCVSMRVPGFMCVWPEDVRQKSPPVTHQWYQPTSATWVHLMTLIATCVYAPGFGITAPAWLVWRMMTERSKCGLRRGSLLS